MRFSAVLDSPALLAVVKQIKSHGLSDLKQVYSVLNSQGVRFIRFRRERYGSVFRTHLLGRPTVVAVGPESVRAVLLADESVVGHTSAGNFRRLLGPGALTSSARTATAYRQLRNAVVRSLTDRGWIRSVCGKARSVVRAEISSWVAAAGPEQGMTGKVDV